ncbi:antibiotic biosynthesis monooxygenase [Marinomonas shanghaiensis]|jgi:quinol monooxygenase YgiN|uniref:antibiotic biosynthesis monooxygenase n=1 Tax=Marinomonas shanghaiensis TaxID=2202418 RepID=UPI003A9457EB
MFIAVYKFEIKEDTEASFCSAWLDVTKAIYKNGGSFGSRLHTSDNPNIFVGYAQWPSREQWEKISDFTNESYQQ